MRRTKGFTLVELLVVIAIIALLLSILMPSLSKARESAMRIDCSSNLRQIGISAELYSQAYNNCIVNAYQDNGVWWAYTLADFMKFKSPTAANKQDYKKVISMCKSAKSKNALVKTVVNTYSMALGCAGKMTPPYTPRMKTQIKRFSDQTFFADGFIPPYNYLCQAGFQYSTIDNRKPYLWDYTTDGYTVLDWTRHDTKTKKRTNFSFLDGHVSYQSYRDITANMVGTRMP
jgi:prepilin-type N-terminal cleavage/methylation domain-containing protein/prepilin-type processing-associated H-X9-DG protein